MYGKGKLILGIILGVVLAVAIFCIAVGVGCAINGLTFSEQIKQWFTIAEEVPGETVANIIK